MRTEKKGGNGTYRLKLATNVLKTEAFGKKDVSGILYPTVIMKRLILDKDDLLPAKK